MATPTDPTRPDVLFGVAYYPEYHRTEQPAGATSTGPTSMRPTSMGPSTTELDPDRLATDLDLMVAAGLTVIRVGESVWSTWEPREGEFDLEWLAPVLDAAHERGIAVLLGTPTYAVPPWLQVAHPEIAAERRTGEPIPWGARQEVDYTHPAFRFHAERVIRAVVGRYAAHPAVIGFQVDNEPGLELFHNDAVFRRFVRHLADRYGDVATLNREWGLTYWSHRVSAWDELWRPDGNTFPQYDLAWRRFQARLTDEFIAWQAGIVREYARADQLVTTCLAYVRPGVDDRTVTEALDITAANPYYGAQDRLDLAADLPPSTEWTSTGVATLLRQADRAWSSKQARFWVTETNAQAIGGPDHNHPPYPGQLTQAALAMVARGASMVEYWHWHSLPYGAETYWGGVLPHSLVPGRVYREVAGIGATLAALGPEVTGYTPDADVLVLWSTPSRYALQFSPPFDPGLRDDGAFELIVDAFHGGVVDAGRQARVMHLEQATALGAAEVARRFPVLVAAGVYVTTDEELAFLRDYAEHGGHLVLGVRTGYADAEARARVAVAPPGLVEAAGVHYEEFANLDAEVPVRGTDELPLQAGASARAWADGLLPDDAQVLAGYDHPRLGDFAAVTTHPYGAGRVTTVGCLPDRALAADLMRWAAPPPVAGGLAGPLPAPVTVASGVNDAGRRVWFAFNWGWAEQTVTLACDVREPGGETLAAGAELRLGPWGARVLVATS